MMVNELWPTLSTLTGIASNTIGMRYHAYSEQV
jgi:hypothetical protein